MDKPQDSFGKSGYEILDVEKLSKEMVSEDTTQMDKLDYEVINIPNIEDSYGTKACCCECHNTLDEKYRSRSKHCMPCGMRYVQGRLYIPYGKGLRPGRVSWSSDEEARRQAVRLGLMQNRSIAIPTSSAIAFNVNSNYPLGGNMTGATSSQLYGTGRRRATSHEPHNIRESDDERISPKRSVKCLRTPTSKTKFSKLQLVKNPKSDDSSKPSCSKSIIKDERLSGSTGYTKTDDSEKLAESLPCGGDPEDMGHDETLVSKSTDNVDGFDPWIHDSIEIHEQPLIKREIESSDQDADEMEDDGISQEDESQITVANIKMEEEEQIWTRDEDKAILLVLQCESDMDCTFEKIKRLLPHRSISEIKDRFQSVMQLLQQMASDR